MKHRNFSSELVFSASRSGGAGGQNVNKVNTKVELRFNIPNSVVLTEEEKNRIRFKLSNKITADGDFIIVSQTERTQLGNKQKCLEKFFKLITWALTPDVKRINTKPTRASKEKRIEVKKMIAQKKRIETLNSMPMFDSSILLKITTMQMPFGKYKGTLICDIPEYYLVWYQQKGFPPGELGMLLSTMYEIKLNGLEKLLQPLKQKKTFYK